jgi:exodeoxyribonuclease VII large subunit
LTAASNSPAFSVSELSSALKRTLEDEYGQVRVRGEISGCKRHSSGHVYLCLKDDRATIDGVIWRGTAQRLQIAPSDGLEVICVGRITTYAARSKYQLVIESLEPAGLGALMALLEERRRLLAAEGLFDAGRKRPLPFLPEVIGVITSPSGAVIRDILHRLDDRFPRLVLLWPVLVQGEQAAAQVSAAIAGFNALPIGGPVPRPDLLIVARGGGSIEDLWPFNDEAVVRAAAASLIPLISAVGHETDTTLIDFAADRRAPTPSAAAEMAVPVRADLRAQMLALEGRRVRALARCLDERRQQVLALGRALPRLSDLLGLPQQRLDFASERLPRALIAHLHLLDAALHRSAAPLRPALMRDLLRHHERDLAEAGLRLREAGRRRLAVHEARLGGAGAHLRAKPVTDTLHAAAEALGRAAKRLDQTQRRQLAQSTERLHALGKLLDSYSYRGVLARGFAVLRDAEGRPLTQAAGIVEGAAVEIEFADGQVPAVIGPATASVPARPSASPRKTRGPEADMRQPSLL